MSYTDTRTEEVRVFQPAKNMIPDRITKGHGTELRGANRLYGSSIDEGRFGRLFRWLMPADFTEAALRDFSDTMVQGEFTKVREENSLERLRSPKFG